MAKELDRFDPNPKKECILKDKAYCNDCRS